MSYYVSLGDVDLDNVASVSQSGERDISTYDSVGGGKFAVAQNKGLREWKIKFQSDDPDMFDDFDRMLRRKTPTRLIIKSDDDKVSERVLLKSYSKEESEYAGVYEVTVTVIEYAKVGVKTAAVPYVAREGTRVLPAQVVTVSKENQATWAFDYTQAVKGLYGPQEGWIDPASLFVDAETGKPVNNPAAISVGKTISLSEAAKALSEKSDKGVQETLAFFGSKNIKEGSLAEAQASLSEKIRKSSEKSSATIAAAYAEYENLM